MVRQLAAANPAHNPMAAANTRLGRESSKLAWHDGHCKFSVRTNRCIRDNFPKHKGQARFHIAVNFVRSSLQPSASRLADITDVFINQYYNMFSLPV